MNESGGSKMNEQAFTEVLFSTLVFKILHKHLQVKGQWGTLT